MKPSRLLASALVCAALSSCAQTPPTPPAASASPAPPSAGAAETESARLSRELRALIGPAACTADAQCRSLPVGAKACGGPAGYLAWSTEGTDAQRMTDLAARQATAQQREIVASGMRSNCAIAVDPGAVCMAGRCQLATPASAR
jgi:hypothetical protein